MEIAVIGASGRTGSTFTRAAMAAGHSVRAVVRDPQRVTVPASRVDVADARSGSELALAIRGVDAVAWCVGPGRETSPEVMATSIAATMEAMREAGVGRLVAITGTGPFDEGDNPLTRYLAKPILWRFLGEVWRDMQVTEDLVEASSLDWTIVRPPRLTDGPARGRYQSRRGRNVRWGFSISRADLAQAMVDVLADPSTVREIVAVAS